MEKRYSKKQLGLYKPRILEAYKMFSIPSDDDPLDKFSYCVEENMPLVENMDRLTKLIEELNRRSQEDDEIWEIIKTKEVKRLLETYRPFRETIMLKRNKALISWWGNGGSSYYYCTNCKTLVTNNQNYCSGCWNLIHFI